MNNVVNEELCRSSFSILLEAIDIKERQEEEEEKSSKRRRKIVKKKKNENDRQ